LYGATFEGRHTIRAFPLNYFPFSTHVAIFEGSDESLPIKRAGHASGGTSGKGESAARQHRDYAIRMRNVLDCLARYIKALKAHTMTCLRYMIVCVRPAILRPMNAKAICIFCDNELGPDTKPEHILLNALGGRKTTHRVICSKHNNDFGGGIDDALADQVEVLRNHLQLESGTGKPPPALKNLQAGSERINIGSDGRPQLVKPAFTVTDLPDGKAEVEIHARTPEDLEKMVPHLAARLRMTEEQVIQQITKNGQASLVEMRPGRIHHQIALGAEQARSGRPQAWRCD
jgi:hypothetical protein